MRFSRLLASAAVAALITGVASTAQAQDLPVDFSATVTVTNDYLFRGISQTGGDAALQASLDVSHETGLFAGVWGSNVDFGDSTDYELDFYAGYANEVGDLSYSVQGIYYLYTDSGPADYNYFELGLDASYSLGIATLGISAYWSPDYSGNTGDAWYLGYSTTFNVSDEISVYVSTGWNGFEEDPISGGHYLNSAFGATYSLNGWVFDVQYSLTDRAEPDNKFVLSLGYTF